MATVHVVVGGVNETILNAILRLASVGIKKELPSVRHERLRHKRRLFIDAKSRVESSKLVVLIDELAVRAQEANIRIFLTDIPFQAEHADVCVLTNQSRVSGELLFGRVVSRRIVRGDE